MTPRRRKGRQLRELTKGQGRENRLNIAEWLRSPKSLVSREEAYQLIREYEYGVARHRWKRNILVRIPWALILIFSAPVRIPGKWAWARIRKWWPSRKEEAGGEE